MTEHGLLYLIGGMTILMLIIGALTLAVVWLVHRDIDRASGLHSPAGWCETCRMRVPDLAEHLAHRHPGFDPPPDAGVARLGVVLLGLTVALVAAACGLWVAGWVAWAQLALVLASGTAGAGVVALSSQERVDAGAARRPVPGAAMSSHVPLCPWLNAPDADTVSPTDCRCFLIRAARADERAHLRAEVEAIPSWEDREGWLVLSYKDVLAVLERDSDD